MSPPCSAERSASRRRATPPRAWYQAHRAVAREPRRSCRRASFRPADDHPLVTVAIGELIAWTELHRGELAFGLPARRHQSNHPTLNPLSFLDARHQHLIDA